MDNSENTTNKATVASNKFLQHFLKEAPLKKSQILTFHALLSAIIIVFLVIPLSIGAISLAILALLAVTISTEFMGLKHGIISGAVFGFTSLILAFTMYAGTVNAVFQNPLVSVLPRVAIPFSIYFVGLAIDKLFKNPIAADSVGAIAGAVTNTALVMLMIFIFYFNSNVQGTVISGKFILGIISINSLIEILFCAVLAPPIIKVLRKVIR